LPAASDQARMDLPPLYPRFLRAPVTCPDCSTEIQCVVCRFAGRPQPQLRKYPGRLGQLMDGRARPGDRADPGDGW